MFKISRKEEYRIRNICVIQEHQKKFIEKDFLPIINFIESKGLTLIIPTILDGWDATFIYKKIQNSNITSQTCKELELFLYSRLRKTDPVKLEHCGLFY